VKKGISLIVLVTIIVVMAILSGIVIISTQDSIGIVNINAFAVEIFNVQTEVDKYYYMYKKYPTTVSYELDITTVQDGSLSQFAKETVTDNKISFKVIDLSGLGITDTQFGKGKDNDIYVVSEVTGKVYYVAGVNYENAWYYTLTDNLHTIANMDNINSIVPIKDIKVYDVVFSVSNVDYTNVPVIVELKLPNEATINSITVTNEKSISAETVDGEYKIIKINETSTDNKGNYTITVDYTYNGAQKTAEYEVTNFDDTVPTLSADESKAKGIRTIEVHAQDLESGIKTIKYAEFAVDDVTFFENDGKALNGTQLKLPEDVLYTLYVEDKAGNYAILKQKPYAIYSAEDDSLTFGYTGEILNQGDTYNGKAVTEIYTEFETTSYDTETDVPWNSYRTNVKTVSVEEKISPISTKSWFQNFINCSIFDLEKLNTTNVTDMSYMFSYAGNASDVTNFKIIGTDKWDTSKVTTMYQMFKEAGKNATTWSVGDIRNWNVSKVINMEDMFYAAGQIADYSLYLNAWSVTQVTSYSNFNYGVESKIVAPNFV